MVTTLGNPKVFVDTNVLLRAHVSSAPLHQECHLALENLSRENTEIWINRQIIREYMVQVTRAQIFAQPLGAKTAIEQVRLFEESFKVADETLAVTQKLLGLMEKITINGKLIHDANIVATMLTCHVTHLLTLNTVDFARFSPLITVLSPLPNA